MQVTEISDSYQAHLEEVLKPLGFVPVEGKKGVFHHELIKEEFDLSAYSPAGVISHIYQQGFNAGAESTC